MSANLGPTRGSRLMYVWTTSIVGAWNWVQSESRIHGIHDRWDWNLKTDIPLSDNDSIMWLCLVIDYITPFFFPYTPFFYCSPQNELRVKTLGQWDTWTLYWQNWYHYRENDGYKKASVDQPIQSANWKETIIVDGHTVNDISNFPEPQQWTRLTVQNKQQKYLTYSWDKVVSSCLTESDEMSIQQSVHPAMGTARDIEIDQVKDISAQLDDRQKVIAEFWAGGLGTISPPLMFIWFWKEYIRIIQISNGNIMYSLQDLAIHLFEGGRVTWRLKTVHFEDRPIQEIRRRFTGQFISSWNGLIDGAQWIPYQEENFVTPPFADFPSGHSHFSKAFALVMTKWFGPVIQKRVICYTGQTMICPLFTNSQTSSYAEFTIFPGSSKIQPGIVPSQPITLSFSNWNDMANQAGMSRLYGGIHAISAHSASQKTAIEVNQYIQKTWNIRAFNLN